jgi:hypothetical protein
MDAGTRSHRAFRYRLKALHYRLKISSYMVFRQTNHLQIQFQTDVALFFFVEFALISASSNRAETTRADGVEGTVDMKSPRKAIR